MTDRNEDANGPRPQQNAPRPAEDARATRKREAGKPTGEPRGANQRPGRWDASGGLQGRATADAHTAQAKKDKKLHDRRERPLRQAQAA